MVCCIHTHATASLRCALSQYGSDPVMHQGVGVFVTHLSGVTDSTSVASMGGGCVASDIASCQQGNAVL